MFSKCFKILLVFIMILIIIPNIVSAKEVNFSTFVTKTRSGHLKDFSAISSLGVNKFLFNQNKTPQFNYNFLNNGNTKLSVKSTVHIINAITGKTVKKLYSIDVVNPARLNLIKIKMDNDLKGIYKAKVETSVKAKDFSNNQTSNEMIFFNFPYLELIKSLLSIMISSLIIHKLLNSNFAYFHQKRLPV